MKLRLPSRRRVVRWIIVTILILIISLYLVMPFAFGFFATRPIKDAVDAPPEGFEAVTLTTSDRVNLAAWYAPPQNGAVIILIHGAGGSRDGVRDLAEMLVEHQFGVLALDLRGHGESEGNTNRFGWEGTRDVGAAITFLQAQDEVGVIGGLGSSLGGEVLLGAASTYPEIAAIVSDGATTRCIEEFVDLDYQSSIQRSFTARILYFSVGLFSGDEPPLPIVDSITAAESTQFLFVAAGKNNLEVDYNEMFRDAVPDRSTLWIVPEVSHTGAFHRYPDEYEQRVITFFENALLSH